jgi:hypothetical protein
MSFWQDGKNLKPKRAYRFIMSVNGQGTDANGQQIATSIPEFLVSKVGKPNFKVTSKEHNFLNHSFHYPGKLTWEPIKLTIVDVIGEQDGTKAVMEMLEAAGYRVPSNQGLNKYDTISKSKSIEALGRIQIRQIDENGDTVETWILNNSWIEDATFGDLDYSSEEFLNVEITIRYDNAIFESRDGIQRPSNGPGGSTS